MVEELEEMEVALKKQIQAFTETPPPVPVEGEEAEALLQKKDGASPAATFEALLQITSHSHSNSNTHVKLSQLSAGSDTFSRLTKAMTMLVNSVWVDPESKKNL